jgi:prepilin-type N-terminal cleavage/methylation domain-containing protein
MVAAQKVRLFFCSNTMNQLPRSRCGFTIVELLVVIAIIGVLTGLLLPAVQSAREAARRTACQNNLKQIGLGLQHYHDLHGAFPIGCVEWRPWGNTTNRQLAWSAYLLPYVEQQPLYDCLNLNLPFDDPANRVASATVLEVFLCPSTDPELTLLTSGRGPSHFGGIYGERIISPNAPPKGVMLLDRAIRIAEVLDGTTFTLIVGEDSRFPDGEWINGRNIFDQAYPINAAPEIENDIRSEHPGGAHGFTCSGSVHFLTETMDVKVLAALCTRTGGEPIGGFE